MATRRKRTRRLGFSGLARKVAAEYRRKGYSARTARRYGQETAGKVAAEKRRAGTLRRRRRRR